MNHDQAAAKLAANLDQLRDGPQKALEVFVAEAKAVATSVRQIAQRSGHSIDIRVIVKGNAVRVTVKGPQAVRYKAIIKRELEKRVPNARTELRAMTTRKTR